MESTNPDRKRPHHNPVYSQVDAIVFDWYSNMRSHDIAVTGPMIQNKALEVAKSLNQPDFKASGGWLYGFKCRHLIGATLSNDNRES